MKQLALIFLFFVGVASCYAQQGRNIVPPRANDTSRIIYIKQAKSLREREIDGGNMLQSAAGDVIIKEGKTTTNCDSAVYNKITNILEAFGNIHINDADSIHTYGQYLKYIGLERIAYIKKNVRLTDKKGTLFTEDLEYNLRTGIAVYKNGGKVINGKTTLTSTEGVYYADTKDIFFKQKVHLKDDKNTIDTDSLQYNLKTGIANFIAPTHIVNADGTVIDTKSGTYNLNTGEAAFFERTTVKDSTRTMTGDRIAIDKASGLVQVEGNGKLVDSVNKIVVFGDQIFIDTKKNAFLATKKPVMMLYKDNDTTFLRADTLFSGLRKYDSLERRNRINNDTLKKELKVNVAANKDSSIRYFIGFRNVKIFNDSLQAVSDSLHYSTIDSTFKLFGKPAVWNGKTQISGDTLHLYTVNQKAKRLYVFNNALVINETAPTLYNQISGRTLNAYFVEGQIDYIRVKGTPAESIFYPQNDDSAFVGMNRSKGDALDVFFKNKEIQKIKYIKDVNGTMYPFKKIPADQKQLPSFIWLDAKRPKSKLELFE